MPLPASGLASYPMSQFLKINGILPPRPHVYCLNCTQKGVPPGEFNALGEITNPLFCFHHQRRSES